MSRSLLLCAILVAGCGGGQKKTGTAAGSGTGTASGSGSGSASDVMVKQTLVHFETEGNKIWLVVTDETGAAKSYPVDESATPCTQSKGGEMEALATLSCVADKKGKNYIAVGRGTDIILLDQAVDPTDDEPSDYEEMTRISVPVGSKLAYGP